MHDVGKRKRMSNSCYCLSESYCADLTQIARNSSSVYMHVVKSDMDGCILCSFHCLPAVSLPVWTCACVFVCVYEPQLITGVYSAVNDCGECGFAVRVRGKYRGGAVRLGLMAASDSTPFLLPRLQFCCPTSSDVTAGIHGASCGLQQGGLFF